MRDPARIQEFCNRLARAWENLPDWRFGQLMANIFKDMEVEGEDPFFPEEDKMIEIIENYTHKMGIYYGTIKRE